MECGSWAVDCVESAFWTPLLHDGEGVVFASPKVGFFFTAKISFIGISKAKKDFYYVFYCEIRLSHGFSLEVHMPISSGSHYSGPPTHFFYISCCVVIPNVTYGLV